MMFITEVFEQILSPLSLSLCLGLLKCLASDRIPSLQWSRPPNQSHSFIQSLKLPLPKSGAVMEEVPHKWYILIHMDPKNM